MKKIVSIYDFLKELGGLERMKFFHANKLKEKFDIQLLYGFVSEKEKENIVRELELKEEIKISQIGKMKNEILQLGLFFLFPKRINKLKTDMVISYSFMASRIAYKKKKKDKTPYLIIICHPPNFLYPSVKGWVNNPSRFFAKLLNLGYGKILRKLDEKYVQNADKVISISEYTKKRVKELYGVNSEVVYPQLSGFFKQISSKEKKLFLKKKKIKNKFMLAHGRIIPDKNYKILLDIMEDFENIDLIISGGISEKYRKTLENKVRLNGLQKRVRILGRISRGDLLRYYNCAELFLLPAKKEDFGLTPIEAMACGTPVIAWGDNAGPNETVQDGINGLLVKPYDLEDFAEKVKRGIIKKWDKKKIVESVRKFSEEEVWKSFYNIIRNIDM
ncbi:MAG: glycosyltransferase family 4 protein [Candidatus Pacearchaeota archaeon]|nr:glycosyltransferase family 4 protein [Candidatus Pacearchaeota archaeon]